MQLRKIQELFTTSQKRLVRSLVTFSFLVFPIVSIHEAWAVPSFADQTGMPCSRCHTTAFGPQLSQFGQQFKLNGYVLSNGKKGLPPVAAMITSSFTHTDKKQEGGAAPNFADNDNFAMDQISLFYAGRVSEHTGAFVQATYDGVEKDGLWDNVDLRYANTAQLAGQNLVWGVSINNSPTVQDLWNSTPAWSYPYIGSALAPTPAAATVIEGTLAQAVYGVTAYTMIDDHYYLEFGGYHTLPPHAATLVGVGADDADASKGLSPYWRLAVQDNWGEHYGQAGFFGMNVHLYPAGDSSAGTDNYTDLGYDANYVYNHGAHNISAQAMLIHELQTLNSSFSAGDVGSLKNQINSLHANVQYTLQQSYVGSIGGFSIKGDEDPVRYAPEEIAGSASGSPNSRGYVAQIEYIPYGKIKSRYAPYLNVRVGLQYTYYTQFNGGDLNYDGFDRDAKDNNTLFGFVWLAI